MLNLLYLVIAITFELCGDASIRIALRGHKPLAFVLGIALLIVYGSVVNLPHWSFNRTMGVYIAIFFIISQIVAKLILHEELHLPNFVGGVLIVAGGLIILLWHPQVSAADPIVP